MDCVKTDLSAFPPEIQMVCAINFVSVVMW